MPDYQPFYSSGVDPTTKYVVERGFIQTLTKSSVFFASFQKWKPDSKYYLTAETKITQLDHLRDNGSGFVKLETNGIKEGYYIWEHINAFVAEIRRQGISDQT